MNFQTFDNSYFNTLFFQSALGRQSAVETKTPNQGQSATRGVQSATEEGHTETWESQFDIALNVSKVAKMFSFETK